LAAAVAAALAAAKANQTFERKIKIYPKNFRVNSGMRIFVFLGQSPISSRLFVCV
jgi:hypothetical protein